MSQIRVPVTKWENPNYHKVFFEKSGVQLGYKCMDDWYKVRYKDIQKKNGGRLILSDYYCNSASSALQSIYPKHNWDVKRSRQKPPRIWKNKENQRKFFDRLPVQLGYKCMD